MLEQETLNIVVVDDHQIILDGLEEMLKQQKSITLLKSFTSAREALNYITRNSRVGLLITDLDMPGMSGDELIAALKSTNPKLKVLALTMHEEKSIISHLLSIGADGYLLKSGGKKAFLKAINEIREGNKYFPENILKILIKEDAPKSSYHPNLNELTKRESEILVLIAEGLSSKEIGAKLFISNRTVETHRTNIMRKLEVHNTAGLIKIAFKSELL